MRAWTGHPRLPISCGLQETFNPHSLCPGPAQHFLYVPPLPGGTAGPIPSFLPLPETSSDQTRGEETLQSARVEQAQA
jgi:hypothetical protein